MLGILLGVLSIGLGLKAFTPGGLPLTSSKRLHGGGAKATGVLCMLVGLVFIADGAFSAWRLWARARPPVAGAPAIPVAAATPGASAPLAASGANWTRHDCLQGGYSVLMPGAPDEEDTPANPAIALLGGHMSIIERPDGSAYMAKRSRFSAEHADVKQELDSARDNVVALLGGKLQSQQDVQLGEHPGREIVVALPDNSVMRTRYFLADKSLFQVSASVARGQESSSETNAFFQSFRLLPTAPQQPDEATNPFEAASSIEATNPFETAMPAETANPFETANPTETSKPVEITNPIEITKPVQITKSVVPEAPAVTWAWHESREGGFSVQMPGAPQEERTPPNPALGQVGGVTVRAIVDGRTYSAERRVYVREPSDVESVIDLMRDKLVELLRGELERQQDLQLAGRPGRELVLSLPDGRMLRTRYCLVGKNVFQILAFVPRGQESSPETNKFFNSFHLLPTQSKAPVAAAWTRHLSTTGGFSVRMPGAPREQRLPPHAPTRRVSGQKLEAKWGPATYSVTAIKYSVTRRDIRGELDAFRDATVVAAKGKLERVEDLTLDGSPGRELVLMLRDGRTMRVRAFFAGRKHYQLLAVVPRGQESSAETNGFFDSFRLLSRP